MAEEKQEKKKAGIIKRIFKWLGLGVLSIILALGIWFQAPWKVITLLLIIFLACTALPKPYRKWFWATAGAVIITLIVWVFLPDKGNWQPYEYNFDEESAVIEAKWAIPDSENAAKIYNQLLEDHDKDTFYAGLSEKEERKIPMREPWRSKDHGEIAKWLKLNRMTIQTLMEAAKIEKCRFIAGSDYTDLGQNMDNLSTMRRWAYLLATAASNDIAENRTKKGLEKYITMLQMAKHMYQQPRTLDMLVGIAIEAMTIHRFNNFIVANKPRERHLSIIEESLAGIEHDWPSAFSRIFEHEKLLAKSVLSNFYEVNPEGKTRLSQDPLADARASAKVLIEDEEMKEALADEEMGRISKLSMPLTYRQRKVFKACTILNWFFIPSTPQKAGQLVDDAYERYYAMAEPDFDWKKGPGKSSPKFRLNFRCTTEFMADIAEGAYYRIHEIYLRLLTDRRGCQLLIGLRRHKNKTGDWPESLDEIKAFVPAETFIDPTNEGVFVYKLTDDSFTLYSKGLNGIDEDGKREDEQDDWQIWPRLKRKSSCNNEEESADAE